MWVQFFIRFHTRPGQDLWLTGDTPSLGSLVPGSMLRMNYRDEEIWELSVDIPDSEWVGRDHIVYRYVLCEPDGVRVEEWGDDRRLAAADSGGKGRMTVIDTWNHAGSYENVFLNSAFRNVLLNGRERDRRRESSGRFTHVFRVKAPLLTPAQELCLTGNAKALGSWERKEAVPMRMRNGWWELRLDLGREVFPFTYKYAVRDRGEGEGHLHYEEGQNRVLHADADKRSCVVLHDGFARLANDSWRGAGIAIPVFSLRSDQGYGVGDFGDIRLLVDWAVRTGLRMIQILPVNDTVSSGTWKDSYPYSAISAFALHPMYLDVRQLAGEGLRPRLSAYEEERKRLNAEPHVDYEKVVELKTEIIRELYPLIRNRTFSSKAYAAFYDSNRHWLLPYAVFCCLRDRFGTADFTAWEEPYRSYEPAFIESLASESGECREAMLLQCFIQYHLHVQLSKAHEYANGKGIILKGDIPIGVNRHGVEAWTEPELFRLGMQAGAPPDDFAVKGQNWGFPTYDWARMQKDGFHWWKLRFEQMSRYFDAFRIDHILGFFRIWSIPLQSVDGIMGRFVPAIPVRTAEFHERGIPFSVERFCRPYITDGVLWELFGADHVLFKPYLRETGRGVYELLPDYDTQRKVRERFKCPNEQGECRRLMDGLSDLITNVILFRDEESGDAFHFRFGMENTSSFRHLEEHVRNGLKDLYVDYFYRRQDGFWKKEAMKRLPALKRSTDMLVCGEDLGMVPSCVPDVMSQLGILSMEVQRMPKNPDREFFHPNDAPYLSVVTPSSHDMSTVREWWTEDPTATQRFFTHELGQYSAAPAECEPWLSRAILRQHLHSPAQWAVFQFQDLAGIDGDLRSEDYRAERINIPSIPDHYWRYRMHLSLEDLLREEGFNNALREDLDASGRLHA